MAVQLDVDVTGAATVDGEYKVTWEAVSSTDMPTEIFLYEQGTDRFDGVITESDLQYPTSPDPSTGYYRSSIGEDVYPDIETANDAKDNVDTAITDLVTAYKDGLNAFLGTTTNNYS